MHTLKNLANIFKFCSGLPRRRFFGFASEEAYLQRTASKVGERERVRVAKQRLRMRCVKDTISQQLFSY